VFYRDEIPLLFEGNVENESDILEWLTQNRHSGDKNTNEIEEISTKNLDIVTSTLQRVLVFQYGSESAENQFTLNILEKLDDRCSFRSIHFVQHKVHEFDTKLILYRNNIPIVFKGNLKEEAAIEEWISTQIENNEKKKASYDLMSFINESKNLLVIFYKRVKEEEIYVIEKIMSECRRNDILALKITDDQILKEFNVTSNLKIIFYEDTIAQEYRGEHNLPKILIWINGKVLIEYSSSNKVEKEDMEQILEKNQSVVCLFFDKNDDSDLAYWDSEVLQQTFKRNNIIAVKNDNIEEARLYGLEEFPSILMFIKKVPRRFEGEMTPEEILDWTLIETGLMKLEKKNSMFPLVEAKDTQIKPTDNEETNNKNDKNDQEETKRKITTIKNENNVVSLFSQDEVISCWPFRCASGKKHKFNRKHIKSSPLYGFENTIEESWITQIKSILDWGEIFEEKHEDVDQNKIDIPKKTAAIKIKNKQESVSPYLKNCLSHKWFGFYCEKKPWYSVTLG